MITISAAAQESWVHRLSHAVVRVLLTTPIRYFPAELALGNLDLCQQHARVAWNLQSRSVVTQHNTEQRSAAVLARTFLALQSMQLSLESLQIYLQA